MSLRTKFPTTEEKRELSKKLFEKHKPILEQLSIEDPLFIPKMNYYSKPLNCRVVGFFESELKFGKDIYVEFVDRYHQPEDPLRRLYVWKFRDPENLEKDEADERFTKYLVPVTDFVLIGESVPDLDLPWKDADEDSRIVLPVEPKSAKQPSVDNKLSDLPIGEMTIRDIVAILHRKPVSSKDWLNELIKQINQ